MWTLKGLLYWCKSNSCEINGVFVPVRPIPFFGLWGLQQRIKDAWAVFTGKAEAFKWPEGQ